MKELDEKNTREQEERIPLLAEDAVNQARSKALSSGRSVIEAVDGKLIETHPDGSHKVLRDISAPIPVTRGQKLIRR